MRCAGLPQGPSVARLGLIAAVAAGVLAAGAGSVRAAPTAGLASHAVAGTQTSVSCLTSSLCVLVGFGTHGIPDVVPLDNGAPGREYLIRNSSMLTDVSCPSSNGCIAVGIPPANRSAALLVKIGPAGKPVSSRLVSVPPGTYFIALTCTSIADCTLAGLDQATNKIEVGLWHRGKLTMRQISFPSGLAIDPGMAVSCRNSSCVVVGDGHKGALAAGLILPVRNGRAGRLIRASGDSFTAVSCVSRTRCYAVGGSQGNGLIMTLTNGVPSSPRHITPGLNGIACSGATCTAVGEQQAPPPTPFGITWGTLVSISSGKATSTQTVSAAAQYDSVARVGGSFTAVGRTPTGSLVTTG
jgi:hypothetical protein